MTTPPWRPRALQLALAGAFVVAVATPAFAQSSKPLPLKSGLIYSNDVQRRAPWSIHYVQIARDRPDLVLTASKARGRVIGLDRLSSQMNALPPQLGRPLAAINGDFYQTESSLYAGDPRGLMVVRGELLS